MKRPDETQTQFAIRMVQQAAWLEGYHAGRNDFWAECPYGDLHDA